MNRETPLTRSEVETRIAHCHQRAQDDPLLRTEWQTRADTWLEILHQRIQDGTYQETNDERP